MSYDHICPEAIFLRDVAEHEMIVVRDDGVHRHIRFKKPGTSCMHFDLITWPGYLCYTGDMGTYVFSRLTDMFEFFRTDREYMRLREGQTLRVPSSLAAVAASGAPKDEPRKAPAAKAPVAAKPAAKAEKAPKAAKSKAAAPKLKVVSDRGAA